jgi:glutamate-ammonia-ligase adenylyltransferase
VASSLAARVRAAPRAHDPARGAAAAAPLGATGPVAELLIGAAGSSAFLCGLIERERDWLAGALDAAPEASMAALLDEAGAGEGPKAAASALRRAKRRAALLIALADLGGVWDLTAVTGALTDLADRALAVAAAAALAQETAGPLKGLDPAAAGLVILAMGKQGARELNYSSDVDLICLFDESRFDPADYHEVKARFVQVVRRVVKAMSEITPEGYVFRTDLRLRPNPTTTPVCIAMEAAAAYYESVGRTWERAAFIKARPAAGDAQAGARFLRELQPFVFRRHLDFAAVEDAHDMRLRIRAHKGVGARFEAAGHDVKLGYGGIREIEFFAQTQQLVRGGRDPSLRDPTTRGALAALTAAGVLDEPTRAELDAAYVAHRTLEHRIQMLDDAQTQSLPLSAEGQARVAALWDRPSWAALADELRTRSLRVRSLCDGLYAPAARAVEAAPEDLAALGFERPEAAAALIEGWRSGRVAATRGERARRRFAALAPALLRKLAAAASPDDAIAAFDRFLSGLPAGVQLFALCEANPQLLDLLAEICAAAPRLAAYLGRHAGVLDAVLDRSFFEPVDGAEALDAALAATLAAAGDYERALDAARRWARERQFRIGVQVLRGVAGPEEAGRAFSAVAEAALRALWPVVAAEFARKHGPQPGPGAAVVAMGKLGSREMTATSDLDVIVIYDPADADESAGPKPLPATQYYARLTQALLAALTAPTAAGALYAVDMRLRPSGRQGPVATRLSSFRAYQAEEAWTWERMALTRARAVAGEPAVMAAADAAAAEALSAPRDPAATLADVREMRARVAEAHRAVRADPWALKHAAGGLMDVEFAVQGGLLATGAGLGARSPAEAIPRLVAVGWLTAAQGAALADAHRLGLALQQVERVALDRPFSPETAGRGLKAAMARAGGAPSFAALGTRLAQAQARADEAATRALAPR